jgi:protein-S-isoprenylcysteine O-methyltransferase Ste14
MTQQVRNLSDHRNNDTAGVIAAPPLIFGAALLASWALHAIHAIRIVSSASGVLRLVGAVLIVLGLLLSIAVVRVFAKAGTQVSPYRAATRFVAAGPYRYTRNPDYIGQMLVYAGIAMVANSWWPLFLLPAVLYVVQRGVVRREERYLEARFGQEYRDYVARVPRWLRLPGGVGPASRRLRFVVMLLAALNLTMEAAHVLELPQKMRYGPELYSAVNTTMYRYFAVVGGPLTVLVLLTGAILVFALRHQPGFRWALVGVAAYYAAFAVWLLVVQPVNHTVAVAFSQDAASLPELWTTLRDRWEYGHVAGFVLQLIGLASLLWSGLAAAEAPRPR